MNSESQYLNTEIKVDKLLDKLKPSYSDKQSLQEMLDETIIMLKEQEKETDKYKIRCKAYEKVIKKQYKKIKELDKILKSNFFANYINEQE